MTKFNKRKVRHKFKELRSQKGTQRHVAQKLGVTETTVRNIENGHSDPGIELIFGFACYFNVSVDELWPDLVERGNGRLLSLTM